MCHSKSLGPLRLICGLTRNQVFMIKQCRLMLHSTIMVLLHVRKRNGSPKNVHLLKMYGIWRNPSVSQQWMLCSEWVPSE